MARDGKPTRDNILAQSLALVLDNGFSGTSIDQILEKSGITKGAFFYHFKTKDALAQALIEEFVRVDLEELERVLSATGHIKDPLDRLLAFIQEFVDVMTELEEPYPGCLYASYTYEPNQFGQEIKDRIADTILVWRRTMEGLLQEALKVYDLTKDVDIRSLADQFLVIFEGAYIVSKAVNEAQVTARQLEHYRNYIKLLFKPKE